MKPGIFSLLTACGIGLAALGGLVFGLGGGGPALARQAEESVTGPRRLGAPFIINEVDSDQNSSDTAEFIEIYDGGTGNLSLTGTVMVLFNGTGDVVYRAYDLDGYGTDAGGYFVIGSVASAEYYVAPGTSGWLQNGPDAVALYTGNAADFPNGTTVTATNLSNLIDALVYNNDGTTDAELQVLLNAGQPQVNENGRSAGTTHSNQRCPNGSGGARNTATYYQNAPTAHTVNLCPIQYDAIILKSGPITLAPGSDITYTLTYSEAGVAALSGVVITDILPAGFTYVSDTSGLTLTSLSPLVWEVGTLPGLTRRSFTVRVTAPLSVVSRVTNTALIASVEPDAAPGSNTASYGTDVVIPADYDLAVYQQVSASELFISGTAQLLTYTVRVVNASIMTDATAFTVTDVLPEGFIYVSDDSGVVVTGTGETTSPLRWSFGTLARNSTRIFHVVISVPTYGASGPYANLLGLTCAPVDGQLNNNVSQGSAVQIWRMMDLTQARGMEPGTQVWTHGYINFPPGLMHNATQLRDEFMMQEAPVGSAGMAVFFSGSLTKFPSYQIGDEVEVHGVLTEYAGKLEIAVLNVIDVMATGNHETMEPFDRLTGQIDEHTEGLLLRTEGTVITVTSMKLSINDGSGVIDVFRDVDIPNLAFLGRYSVGDKVRAVGVSTQYDPTPPYESGYELGIRYRSDVLVYPRVISVFPAVNASDVLTNAVISVTFNTTMTNIDANTFMVQDSEGQLVPGLVTYTAGTHSAQFRPVGAWNLNTRYMVQLNPELTAEEGLTMTDSFGWYFSTQMFPNLSSSSNQAGTSDRLVPGSLVTYTLLLSNQGYGDATVMVTDVLPSYYTLVDRMDMTAGANGLLTWQGLVTEQVDVPLHFVVRVVPLTSLPPGLTVLSTTMQVNDGFNPVWSISDARPPTVIKYVVELPVVQRKAEGKRF